MKHNINRAKFKCEFCGKEYAHKKSLTNHLDANHGNREEICF